MHYLYIVNYPYCSKKSIVCFLPSVKLKEVVINQLIKRYSKFAVNLLLSNNLINFTANVYSYTLLLAICGLRSPPLLHIHYTRNLLRHCFLAKTPSTPPPFTTPHFPHPRCAIRLDRCAQITYRLKAQYNQIELNSVCSTKPQRNLAGLLNYIKGCQLDTHWLPAPD